MKNWIIRTIVLLLIIIAVGCNKKDDVSDTYKFIIDDIDTDEYIKCDYGKQKNGEHIIFIYEQGTNTILKNATYVYDLTNYKSFDDTCDSNNQCEYVEKGKGAIIVYTVVNYAGSDNKYTLEGVQKANGASCSTIKK